MSEFIDDIAARLVGQGVGVIGTDLFLSSKAIIPAGDGPFTSLHETGGTGPTHIHNQASAHTQRPTVQVLIRAADYPTARGKARAAYRALDGVFNTTINGTFYLSITARQEPTDIGLDGVARPMVSFNIDAEKAPS